MCKTRRKNTLKKLWIAFCYYEEGCIEDLANLNTLLGWKVWMEKALSGCSDHYL